MMSSGYIYWRIPPLLADAGKEDGS